MNEKKNKIGADGGEKNEKQQAILFDLDGTLLNTLDDLTSSVNVTLQAHGFPLRRKEEIRKFLGNGSEFLMRSLCLRGRRRRFLRLVWRNIRHIIRHTWRTKPRPTRGFCLC